jgi:hypothetical protein
MTEEKASSRFAFAGLFAPVGAAWALLLIDGGLDGDWLLAGVLALGAGMLAVNLMQRLVPGVFAAFGESGSDVPATPESDAEEPETQAPRLRVLVASSGLQGLSAALLTVYFLGDVAVSVAAGLAFGALGMAVSVVLSRKLSPA